MDRVLLPGERLLWSGRPVRLWFGGADWFLLGMGLVWGELWGVFFSRASGSAFGIVFGVLALGMIWGRVFARQRALRRTEYVVTDRRIVLANRVTGETRASAYLETLAPPIVHARPDGSGTVRFDDSLSATLMSVTGVSKSGPPVKIELVAIADAQRVRDLIASAQERR